MEKNKHVLYTDFPDIRDIQTRVYWGIYTWTLSALKRRWLLRDTALTLENMICSPADTVRDYLDFYHPNPLRATGIEVRNYEEYLSAPLYVYPSTILEGTYIDIKSTYYSIVKLIGWDINYLPGRWLTPGRAPLDFPLGENKPARNYLVSIGLPGEITVWTGYRWASQRARNVHINLGLWTAVMDVLHSIAAYAVHLGAVYVHTDGYILPTEKAESLQQYIRQFRLTSEVRAQGPTIVLGFADYMVGERLTKNFIHPHVQAPFSNIYSTKSRFLMNTIQRIDDNRIPELLFYRSIGG